MTGLADEVLNDDYDSPWKDAIERYLPEFMAAIPRSHPGLNLWPA